MGKRGEVIKRRTLIISASHAFKKNLQEFSCLLDQAPGEVQGLIRQLGGRNSVRILSRKGSRTLIYVDCALVPIYQLLHTSCERNCGICKSVPQGHSLATSVLLAANGRIGAIFPSGRDFTQKVLVVFRPENNENKRRSRNIARMQTIYEKRRHFCGLLRK